LNLSISNFNQEYAMLGKHLAAIHL